VSIGLTRVVSVNRVIRVVSSTRASRVITRIIKLVIAAAGVTQLTCLSTGVSLG
jgi:regulator of extracellular matrix RemA (YlzA/DUF370 family)